MIHGTMEYRRNLYNIAGKREDNARKSKKKNFKIAAHLITPHYSAYGVSTEIHGLGEDVLRRSRDALGGSYRAYSAARRSATIKYGQVSGFRIFISLEKQTFIVV